MNTNTIPTATIKVTRHSGPGQHRASKKIAVDDQLSTATENRRRNRKAKQIKGGRYRADTNKINLGWLIWPILVFAVAFSGGYGLLIGAYFPERVITYQTKTQTIERTYETPVIPEKCYDALDSADKGFDLALDTPKVKLEKIGKKKEISHETPKTVKFFDKLQTKVHKQKDVYEKDKAGCTLINSEAKQVSETKKDTTDSFTK